MTENNTFVITRTLNAPRELVWKVWTEKEHLMKWFGPKGVTMPTANMDFRPGGTFHYSMKTPDGNEMWGKWTFREIVPKEKIVLVNSFSDENGGISRHPLSTSWPLETLSSTTLSDQGNNTLLTLMWEPVNATSEETQMFNSSHEGMNQGWSGTFEQLDAYLRSIQ